MRFDALRLCLAATGAALALVSLAAMVLGYAAWRGLALGLLVAAAVLAERWLNRGRAAAPRPPP